MPHPSPHLPSLWEGESGEKINFFTLRGTPGGGQGTLTREGFEQVQICPKVRGTSTLG